jgi:hypothetical protein
MGMVDVGTITWFTHLGRQKVSLQLVYCGKKILPIKIDEYLK